MPLLVAPDGVKLYFEESGAGFPILFLHEYGGDHRSWAPQLWEFSRDHRCIVFAARGYPPSDVPACLGAYSYLRARDDAIAVLDGLCIQRAHVVGLSMGGYTALHVAAHVPNRVASTVAAGVGSGAPPDQQERFRQVASEIAAGFGELGMKAMADQLSGGPEGLLLRARNPELWHTYREQLGEHSADGMRLTILGVHRDRPSLWSVLEDLQRIESPILVLNGDADDACLDVGIFLKRNVPSTRLQIIPGTGHISNLEDPVIFNRCLREFFASVESARLNPSGDLRLDGTRTVQQSQ